MSGSASSVAPGMTSTHLVFQTDRPISRVSVFSSSGSRSSVYGYARMSAYGLIFRNCPDRPLMLGIQFGSCMSACVIGYGTGRSCSVTFQ